MCKNRVSYALLAEKVSWIIHGMVIIDLLINPGVLNKEFYLKWTCDFLYLRLHHSDEINTDDILMETQVKF